ncbi:MAG: hypothetical protein COB46_08325 [Rhodospirillaceae bacterium]|nr:MAG: hypothetical protein COB46_08325 [Rhodospirillaceae bacterium]
MDKADDYFQQALAINKELGIKEIMANQLSNLGIVAHKRGDMTKAVGLSREALVLYQDIGMPHRVKLVQSWIDEVEAK